MRVYFTQQQLLLRDKKGAKFLDRACVRCGCAIQVKNAVVKAAKDATHTDAHTDDKRGRKACARFKAARAAEEAAARAAAGGDGAGERQALGSLTIYFPLSVDLTDSDRVAAA